MNYISQTRQRMLDQIEAARDWRSEEQKLADAVDRHLANIGLLSSFMPEQTREVAAARAFAQKAFDQSQAELFRLVEDICLIDPIKLGKALAYATI